MNEHAEETHQRELRQRVARRQLADDGHKQNRADRES